MLSEEHLRKRREKDSARKALVASSESQEERASKRILSSDRG